MQSKFMMNQKNYTLVFCTQTTQGMSNRKLLPLRHLWPAYRYTLSLFVISSSQFSLFCIVDSRHVCFSFSATFSLRLLHCAKKLYMYISQRFAKHHQFKHLTRKFLNISNTISNIIENIANKSDRTKEKGVKMKYWFSGQFIIRAFMGTQDNLSLATTHTISINLAVPYPISSSSSSIVV